MKYSGTSITQRNALATAIQYMICVIKFLDNSNLSISRSHLSLILAYNSNYSTYITNNYWNKWSAEWVQYKQLFPGTDGAEFQNFVEVVSSIIYNNIISTSYSTEDKILKDLTFQEIPKKSIAEGSDIDDDIELPSTIV